jgi:hypothetical protein
MPLTQLVESDLLSIARERIEERKLPRIIPERAWGTPKGDGQLCSLCDRAITPAQVLLELDGWPDLQFHVGCHAMWVRQCRALEPRNTAVRWSGVQW